MFNSFSIHVIDEREREKLNQKSNVFSEPYRLSFTSASLRPDLARISVDAYLATGSWPASRQNILQENAFQSRSKVSLERMEREIRPRLQQLTRDQLMLLSTGTSEDRAAMAWLATIKYAALPWELAADVLRSKLAAFDPIFRPSDYTNFIAARVPAHPELEAITDSSRRKIRRFLLLMLMEAGLLKKDKDGHRITRPVLTPKVIDHIVADDPRYLAGFLWTDEEVNAIRKGK